MKIRWEGDNFRAIEKLLEPYGTVRYHEHGHCSLRIVAKEFAQQAGGVEMLQDAEMVVELGDTLHYRRGADGMSDSIGIERPPDSGDDSEIVWTGNNPFDIAMFVRKHDRTVRMNADDLILKRDGADDFIRMRRGDKLVLKGGSLFMSRVGVDHRG
jgi:hypothetical protein